MTGLTRHGSVLCENRNECEKVMLDTDLAVIYSVSTKTLNQAVK